MRVSTQSVQLSALTDLNRGMSSLLRAQAQATSGKRFTKASEDPAGSAASMTAKAEQRQVMRWQRSADDAAALLGHADNILVSVQERLERVQGLMIQANSGAIGDSSRQAVASELRAIREELLGYANTQNEGRSLFGGTEATAYDAAGVWVGNSAAQMRNLTKTKQVQVNIVGTDMFGAQAVAPADPLDGDLFQVLEVAATAIEANDTARAGQALTNIQGYSASIAQAQVTIGARSREVESARTLLADRVGDLDIRISDVEDAEMEKVFLDVMTRRAAYEASLSATSKLITPTLANFLR